MLKPRQLSVVIPTCKRLDLLEHCLDRLAPGVQTLSSEQYEVIVSDDSLANSAKTLVESNYSWARWTKGSGRGPAANRNHGAALAFGPWLVFTDDDCLPEKDWLAAFKAAFTEEVAVYEGQTVTDEPSKGLLFTAPVNRRGGFLWSCNFAVRKSLFDELSGFDESFPGPHLEDVDFRMRVSALGEVIQFVPAAQVCHPQRYAPPGPRRVWMYESGVYLARKHGISLAEAGLSWRVFGLQMVRGFKQSAGLVVKLKYAVLTVLEWLILLPRLLWWIVQYSHFNASDEKHRPALRPQT